MLFNHMYWAELESCMQALEERPEIVSENHILCYLQVEPLRAVCVSVKLPFDCHIE